MGYPTTIILLALISSVTALGWNGTIDSATVTTIFGGIVSGVLVGHYVKTSGNGPQPLPPGSTVTTTTPKHTETSMVAEKGGESL